jgi:hypothetical protein
MFRIAEGIALPRKLKHRGLFRVGWIFTFAAVTYHLGPHPESAEVSSQTD